LAGCVRSAPQAAAAVPPKVKVSPPVKRDVTDFVDFTGRTQAVQSVNVVARATGYLRAPKFKEGSMVKKDDLLFEIDPTLYQDQYDQAIAQVNLYQAQLGLAQVTLDRDEQLVRTNPGAVSKQQLDQDRAAVDQAKAQVKSAEASRKTSEDNLNFCKVTAPIDGQVSRYYITTGNLVSQDQTLLTTVVSFDPMYAYVDVDSLTVLKVKQAINEGKMKPYQSGQIPIFMGLQSEEGFPHAGFINFVNNQENPTTGTILARGQFDNPMPPGGRRLLVPGMFVRMRLPIGQPHSALLVIDSAVLSDQSLKTLYVVDGQNKVQSRTVTTGPLESDGLRQIIDGLKEDDRVVVDSLQQVKSNLEIQPVPVDMLSLVEGRGKKNTETEPVAKASPQTTGTASTALSVLGADADGGESSLTYTWSASTVPEGAAAPVFSINGSNAAKNTLAALSKAGTYGFTVTIANTGSLSVTSSVSVAVAQTLTSIAVSPATATVNPGATQQFTATGLDQFNTPLAAQPRFVWSATAGKITEAGLFTAQDAPGSGKVTAGARAPGRGALEGASTVTVSRLPTVVIQAKATSVPAP
jgi:multidrug efflux system membrane fusion protein